MGGDSAWLRKTVLEWGDEDYMLALPLQSLCPS